MNASVRVGRILGIPLEVNWGWLIVFGFLIYTLGHDILPSENPGLKDRTYYVMAVVAALAFFGSIVLHELGHALVARREGMEIEGITLWLFGGIARFAGVFPSAGAELRIACAGPLVTLVLGGIFVGVDQLALPSPVDGVLAWLGYINLLLLVFNLIPALPLDGGRILRSIMWRLKGDYVWATVRAALAGRGLSLLMIGTGIVLFIFQGAGIGGLWFAFIGWFLYQASTIELRQVAISDTLQGLTARNIMTEDVIALHPEAPLGHALDSLEPAERHSAYPVIDNDAQPFGLLSMGTLAAPPRSEWESHRVRDFMLPLEQVPTVNVDDDAAQAVEVLQTTPLRHALVLEDGHLAGVLTLSDLADAVELRRPIRQTKARR
jgi:Zn-dependent protease/predicted transcriptional regulator